MSNFSRRSLVCGSVALTSLAVPAVSADLVDPDAAVLDLVQRCTDAVQAWDAASSVADAIEEGLGESAGDACTPKSERLEAAEEHAERLWDLWQDLETQLIQTPAVTLKGLSAKARYVSRHEDRRVERSIVRDLCAVA
jgi:hypothetical protein